MQIFPADPSAADAKGPQTASLTRLRVAPSAASRAQSPVDYVEDTGVLSPLAARLLWVTVLLLILTNTLVLAVFTLVYAQSERYNSLLWLLRNFFLFSDANTFLQAYSTRMAAGYGVLSVIFAGFAVRMIACNHFRMGNRLARLTDTTRRLGNSARSSSALVRSAVSASSRAKAAFLRARRAVGVRGEYFDLRLLVDEWIELGTQTAAAYSSSYSISNVPLNLTYAIVIFINSTSSLVYTRVFPKSIMAQRLACVATDLVLDFVWGTLLPVWMYVPIVRAFVNRNNLLDDLTAYSSATREVERILVLSWRRYAISLLPFCSSLIKLVDLQMLLRALVSSSTGPSNSDPAPPPPLVRIPLGRQRHNPLVRIAHALMPIFGLAVLLTSLAAHEVFSVSTKQLDIPCEFRVHPWFSTKEACIRRKINCTVLGIAGHAVALQPMLDLFDRGSLAEVHFVDCPALEMPGNIGQFSWLMTIVVRNATLVKWDTSAEISDAFFVDLRAVHMYGVRFVDDPVGFTGSSGPIASCVEWIQLENIDGNRLLPLVGHHWHALRALSCNNCGLVEFPDAWYKFPQLRIFSLAFNDLPSFPEDWALGLTYPLQMLWLDVNPRLTELPDSLWRQAATCGVFSLGWTNLSVVPEWVADIALPGFKATTVNTPVCTGQVTLSPRAQTLVRCNTGF